MLLPKNTQECNKQAYLSQDQYSCTIKIRQNNTHNDE